MLSSAYGAVSAVEAYWKEPVGFRPAGPRAGGWVCRLPLASLSRQHEEGEDHGHTQHLAHLIVVDRASAVHHPDRQNVEPGRLERLALLAVAHTSRASDHALG